jgi:paraquat-inducible protein B
MNDAPPDAPDAPEAAPAAPAPRRRRFPWIWLIPIAAAAIALWLGWQSIAARGPMVTITFDTADGLAAGRTHVTHKAVELGTVDSINLTGDMRRAEVHVRMNHEAARMLTDHARFWVVRPRLTPGNISGLETIVSGAYIEMDPGAPGGQKRTSFEGLPQPPGVRSDEPGTTFTFRLDRAGSLGQGAPVYLHDIEVGEVLDRELTGDHVTMHAFVRSPFDKRVHAETPFWNASGVAVGVGAQGLRVQLESLQAVLQGGLAFDDLPEGEKQTPPTADTVFRVYPNEAEARAAMPGPDRVRFVTYLQGNVSALAPGSPVLLYGQRVGSVTELKLEYDAASRSFRVPVRFSVNRDAIAVADNRSLDPLALATDLLAHGLHVETQSVSLLTGQQGLAFAFGGKPAKLEQEGDAIVVPGQAGGLDNIMSQASALMTRLGDIPIDQIAARVQHILDSTDALVSGPELRDSLRSLKSALAETDRLVKRANAGFDPVLKRLPQIAEDLERTTSGTARLVNGNYAANSDFQRQLERLLDQATETLRSIRMLADFFDRHPEALIRGRTESGGTK